MECGISNDIDVCLWYSMRTDPRNVISYNDLDAPADVD